MGVPKFFRYISERYPCLSELVKEYQIPEFDNLYLDMNGIIHMCSHPDDNNPHFRITEERIFKDIFHYIEVLFRMIRPQKLFFMAVDGVAPRAKMNQQRGRRFRSAKDAEKQESDAIKKGETLPDVARFDSNCITPGTVFMARLHEQLKYFVVSKMSSDPTWQKCKIILSGHETPGEGEHKIMDYIRYLRAQPGYDPNTRHCLYGLDADLIMLGLCTHEPHFSLLREEVKFGKKSTTKRASVPEEITFYLLHLSLMREYLELEFSPLRSKLQGFKYDFEKIIDDWVLMGFLVGNDFIPHLPNLHIANGALPILYKAYIDILPSLDGYINEAGTLNLARFEKFMEKLGNIDLENFEEIKDDLLYMEAKTGRKWNSHTKVSTKNLEEWSSDDKEGIVLESLEPEIPRDSGIQALIDATNEMILDSEEEQSEEDDAFENYKKDYYRNKLEYANITPEVMRDQAEGYVRAIQWNLNYYYNGCCSWSWYYPHHYAPYISDIKGFSDLKIEFDLGRPFLPYEQLLAVLPSASKTLLPECYHHLMTDEDSLIKRYYPEDFQTDLNGKKQEWEAVVLVPFIDEKVLLEAMQTCNDKLTPEEKKRNSHGPMLVYTYTPEDRGLYPAPEYFPSVKNHTDILPLNYDEILVPREKLVKGAYPGVRISIFYPGFPTMKHLKYRAQLKKGKIRVFETPSRNENMIVSIINEKFPDDKIPVDLLGTTVWVGWPHLVEAKVVSISNSKRKYVGVSNAYNAEERTGPLIKQFDQEVEGITEYYQKRMGIEVGETKVLVHVQVMTGRRYVFAPNGRINLEKVFTENIANYPLQAIVYDINTYDSHHSTFREIQDVFPVGSTCFTLTNPYYGSQGVVQDSKEALKNGRLKICITVFEEPDFMSVKELHSCILRDYKSLYHAASQLSISNFLFSRVTGSIFITARNGEGGLKNVNIGLDLKFNKKNKETPGYTKKIDNTWLYTDKAVELVRQYMEKYPEVFSYLNQEPKFDEINAESIFDEDWDEKLKELQGWLRTLPTHSLERQPCGGAALEPEEIKEIERIIDETSKNANGKRATMQIKPNFLYRSEVQNGTLPPDPKATTQILDRIINVRCGFSVPLGLKGTVISIHESATGSDRDTMYDVVFDETFPDGMSLNCSEGRGYRLPKNAFINISYGQRLMIERTGKPNEVIANAESSHRNAPNTFNGQGYNRPQQQSWFSASNQPLNPFVPIQPSFQKENSAFVQFSTAQAQNKPYPQYGTPRFFQDYNDSGGNKQPRQQNYNRPQDGYNRSLSQDGYSRSQDSYNRSQDGYNRSQDGYNRSQDGYNRSQDGYNRSQDNYNRSQDNYNRSQDSYNRSQDSYNASQANYSPQKQQKSQNSKSGDVQNNRVLKQQKSNDFMPNFSGEPKTSKPQTQQNPQRPSVNVDILKTILKIGKEREEKSKEDAMKSAQNVDKGSTSDTTQDPNPISNQDVTKDTSSAQNGLFDMFAEAAKAPATVRLLTYYQSNGLGLPRYQYFNEGDLIRSQITLSNGKFVVGDPAVTREIASENVAADVLNMFLNKAKTGEKPDTLESESSDNNQDVAAPSKTAEASPRGENTQGSKTTVLNNSFVPLQAIKSHRNKSNSSSNRTSTNESDLNSSTSERQEYREISARSNRHTLKGQKANSQNRNKPPRKTRIAANFDLLKKASDPPSES